MDQAPGPIIARLMPRVAKMSADDCVPGWVKADPHLHDACQHSRYGGPQASENEKTGGSADDL